MTLSVCIVGTDWCAKNEIHLFLMIDREKNPVVPNPAPKYAFPQSLNIFQKNEVKHEG